MRVATAPGAECDHLPPQPVSSLDVRQPPDEQQEQPPGERQAREPPGLPGQVVPLPDSPRVQPEQNQRAQRQGSCRS